jgi:hypothetical protein
MQIKIISGGQTGADRAALDVALHLGFPHGGWVPKGRRAEDGRIPSRYELKEMPTDSYPERTKANVDDSNGTLILTRGRIDGGSKLTFKYANASARPCLHINLKDVRGDNALYAFLNWMTGHQIDVLNVAGTRASKDPLIYDRVFEFLNNALLLLEVRAQRHLKDPPLSIETAIEQLSEGLSFKDKTKLTNLNVEEMIRHHPALLERVRNEFGLWRENSSLLASCRSATGDAHLHQDQAVNVILERLWQHLRQKHKLRLVK